MSSSINMAIDVPLQRLISGKIRLGGLFGGLFLYMVMCTAAFYFHINSCHRLHQQKRLANTFCLQGFHVWLSELWKIVYVLWREMRRACGREDRNCRQGERERRYPSRMTARHSFSMVQQTKSATGPINHTAEMLYLLFVTLPCKQNTSNSRTFISFFVFFLGPPL